MTKPSPRGWTTLGLAIAFLGIPAITTAHRVLAPDPLASGAIVARELSILALTALLLWLVVSRERKPLTSIGLRTDHAGRSLVWGIGLAAVCLAAAVAVLAVYGAIGIHYGEGKSISRALPVTMLTVVRAGISEEVFYRGYAIERLRTLTGSKWVGA